MVLWQPSVAAGSAVVVRYDDSPAVEGDGFYRWSGLGADVFG